MHQVIAHIEAHLDEFIDRVTADIVAANLGVYRDLPPAQIRVLAARAFAPLVEDLQAGSTVAYPTFWRQVGPQRAQAGVAIGDLLGLIDNSMSIMSANHLGCLCRRPGGHQLVVRADARPLLCGGHGPGRDAL